MIKFALIIIILLCLSLVAFGDSSSESSQSKAIQCGDVNLDGAVNIFDATFLISFLYNGGPAPAYMSRADVNDDSDVNIFDITALISYLYQGGAALNCPSMPSQWGEMISYSECLSHAFRDAPPDQDCIDYKYDGSSVLLLTHQNACFNCCPENILADVYVYNNTISIYEDETYDPVGGPCPCLCLNNIDYQFTNIPPGEYTVRIYGLCLFEGEDFIETTINLASEPEGLYCITRTEYPWGWEWYLPYGEMTGRSDCHMEATEKDTTLTEDCIIYEYDGAGNLTLTHLNDLFNCCPDSLMANMTVDDSIISITEIEDLSSGGCYCICLYDMDYEINFLPPGIYMIKVDNPFYYGEYDNGIIIEFTVDLTGEVSGHFCVDRPYLPLPD